MGFGIIKGFKWFMMVPFQFDFNKSLHGTEENLKLELHSRKAVKKIESLPQTLVF